MFSNPNPAQEPTCDCGARLDAEHPPESPSNSPPSSARKISSSIWSATPTGRKTRSPHGSGRSGTGGPASPGRSTRPRTPSSTEGAKPRLPIRRAARALRQAGKSGPRATRLFVKIFLEADDEGPYVARDELAPMVAPLVDMARHPGDEKGAVRQDGASSTGGLLRAALADAGSSKPPMVELRGLEPLTPTLPVWCATSCATAPCARRVAPGTEEILHTPVGGSGGPPV